MNLPKIYLLLFIFISCNCSQCSDFIFGDVFIEDPASTCESLATSSTLTNCFLNDDASGCVEKECKDIDPYSCSIFTPKDNLKKCIENPESEKCQLFTCSELNENFCHRFQYTDDNKKFCIRTEKGCELKTCEEAPNNCGAFYPKGNKYCVYKQNSGKEPGCEYKSCEELSSGNCRQIYFSNFGNNNDYDAVCTDNNDGHCITKRCSLLTENCENLVLENPGYKCISDGNGNCFTTKKNCEEIAPFQCGSYYTEEDYNLGRVCINNKDNTSCILTTCEALPSSECNRYNYGNSQYGEKCTEIGGKCELIKCEELPKDKCHIFGYFKDYSKCIPSENNCKLVTCNEMPTDKCENFILQDPLYKCTNKANQCTIFVKDCEELSVEYCNRFYNYYNDKICTPSEDNKKCELKDRNDNKKENENNDNMIKFSFYFFGLLLLF